MEVEKLSVEEIRQQAESILHMLDAGLDRIKGKHFNNKISDGEARALMMGAECAIAFLSNFYLSKLDDADPQIVASIRDKSAIDHAALIVSSAADTYIKFFAGGDQ